MATVTQIVNNNKQPREGFLPTSLFEKTEYDDGRELNRECIKPARMGLLVDYLTRFSYLGSAEEAFNISLLGARYVNQEKTGRRLCSTLDNKGLNSFTGIAAAYDLTSYDIAYRAARQLYSGFGDDIDKDTALNAAIMVKRSRDIMGDVRDAGVFFPNRVFNSVVHAGDGDYITEDGILYDMKVSKYGITTKDTFQILMYAILAEDTGGMGVNGIGIVNPRLNVSYTCGLDDVPDEAFENALRLMGRGPNPYM